MVKEEAFVEMIKQNEGVIFKITTIYADNADDQKDLYQDIVYQLWKSFDSFREEAKISTWMYRVAMNTALTRIRKKKRQGNQVSIDKVVLQQTAQDDSGFEERLKQVYASIHQLNALEKGLILLLLEGKNYAEISEITGLTPSNVGTRLSRIKQKLKSKINKK
ncbi:MAG: sigma-70 family RNA polymerase sigma factor [Flavobacteriaceae bacterium]